MGIKAQYSYEVEGRILTWIQAYHQIVGKNPHNKQIIMNLNIIEKFKEQALKARIMV